MANMNIGGGLMDAINNVVNSMDNPPSRIKSNIYSSSNKNRGAANQTYDENGNLTKEQPAWKLEGQENKAEDLKGDQITDVVQLEQLDTPDYDNQDISQTTDVLGSGQDIIRRPSGNKSEYNIEAAGNALEGTTGQNSNTEGSEWDEDSYLAAWDKYRKEHGIDTDSIFQYAVESDNDSWWNMMHDPIMMSFYQNVLDDLGDDYNRYFEEYGDNLSTVSQNWDNMLKYIGTDADAIRQSIDWLIGTDNFVPDENGNYSPLFELADDEGFPMPDFDEETMDDTIKNYGDIISTLYLENAAKNYYDNGNAGEAFVNAFTPEEITKLTPLEYWNVTDKSLSKDVFTPDEMNFHELTPDLENELTRASYGTLDEYGTPNIHTLPAINRAANGMYNYTWRPDNERDASGYRYKNSENA